MKIAVLRGVDSTIGVCGMSDSWSMLRTMTDAIVSSYSCDEIHYNRTQEDMWDELRSTRRLKLNVQITHSDDSTESIDIIVTLTKLFMEQPTPQEAP